MFFCCSIYIETAQNSSEECNEFADLFFFEDYHYAFQETLCPVTLAHYIFAFHSSLYFYTSDTFHAILALFIHFTLHQFFLIYIATAVARNVSIIFDFSSLSPHLNYISLSKVNSFDPMEFSMKH